VTGRRTPAPLYLAAFLLLVGAFYALTIRPGHDWGDDFAQYIHHAKNIALGIDYSRTGYIWNPRFPMLGPATYPPVFPLLLAPVYAARGLDLVAMKVVVAVFFLLALFMVARVFRDRLRSGYLATLLLLLGLNPYFWHLKDNVLSDIPFLFFVFLTLDLMDRHPGPRAPAAKAAGFAAAIGTSCYLAYGTRSLGMVLIGCLIVADVVRWRRLTGVSALAIAWFAVLAAIQAAVTHRDAGYAAILTFDPHRIADNAVDYIRYLSGLWDNAWWGSADSVLLLIFGALAAAGIWMRARSRRVGPPDIFAGLYGLAILPWVATQGRYLVPLMPFYIAYALEAIQADRGRTPRRAGLTLAALLALAGVGFVSEYFGVFRSRGPEGVGTPNAQALFNAVRRTTDSSAVIVFQKPRALALFTDRQATGIHEQGDEDDFWSYLDRVGANYAILAPDDRVFLYQNRMRRVIQTHPDRFLIVYSNPDFALYRILRAAPRSLVPPQH
jgi:hypothetical protein